ncbi:MAG: MMPL family transporter [Deltaproteobacteria bacterium]|nr:MMPL family transporter [Deltaproteobacteria bacterium]MBI3387097.1 MMPL family transporter [Deltaproteobacteria bacterium]
MLPKRLIEKYLHFLLRYRVPVSIAIGISTLFLLWFCIFRLTIYTNFIDLYPPGHPYIQTYFKYRSMFGTSNVLVMTLEVQKGDLFSDPEIIHKVDRITLDLLHNVPGVNGEQVISITHPKLKTTLTSGSGIKVVPLVYPKLPDDQEELDFLRQKIYTTEGVRGLFVSKDDKATLITAGFWEEYIDLATMWQKVQEIVKREEADGKVKIYVAGPPILFAYFQQALGSMGYVLAATGIAMILLLWFYFRTVQGVVIPTFSGLMSAVWGLGFAGLAGLTLDPLVLVVFVLITARALSHSVQSMERYHEEYFRLKDKRAAIVSSYVSLYSPAMVSIASDTAATLTIAVASIPLMQKLAFVAAFWILSIFLSVVTLHPIILSFVRPPKHEPKAGQLSDRFYNAITRWLIALGSGTWRWAVVATFALMMVIGVYFGHHLKTGDTEPGHALLYKDHPYNVAFSKVNEKFAGASQLVIIAEGKRPEAIKDAHTLNQLDLFQRYMEQGEGADGSLTATTLLKKIFRTFHEGDPKWEMLPTRNDHVGQLFFLLTSGTSRGEMDRFFSPDYNNATVTIFYKNYTNEVIHGALDRAKAYIAQNSQPNDSVRYLLAGGLLGLLAATNEEVDWSYRVNVPLIFFVVFLLSFATYRSVVGALIVMIPSLVAQPLSEAVMYFVGIDFNINSLPVAAIGIGIGIDYGYYVLSRIVEEYEVVQDFDEANRRAIATTGKAIIFTGTTLVVSVMFWLFHPLKFEAEMAFLLMMLMIFHAIGALVFIPALVSLLKPRFAIERAAQRVELAARTGTVG